MGRVRWAGLGLPSKPRPASCAQSRSLPALASDTALEMALEEMARFLFMISSNSVSLRGVRDDSMSLGIHARKKILKSALPSETGASIYFIYLFFNSPASRTVVSSFVWWRASIWIVWSGGTPAVVGGHVIATRRGEEGGIDMGSRRRPARRRTSQMRRRSQSQGGPDGARGTRREGSWRRRALLGRRRSGRWTVAGRRGPRRQGS